MKYYTYTMRAVAFLVMLFFLMSSSCEDEISQAVKLYNGGDTQAPSLTSIKAETAKKFIMEFNEPLSQTQSSIEIDNDTTVSSVETRDNTVTFELAKASEPGKEYTITATVQDMAGNVAMVVEKIYGFNPTIPSILINEFITEGMKTNPDKVELRVLSNGNTAGITLQEGGIRTYKQRVTLPAIDVQKDDFIIVHFRAPEGSVSETTSKTQSTLPIAEESAWDIFHTHPKLTGIANDNGALVLLQSPNGQPMDAVVYSSKKDDATHERRGFASKDVYAWVTEIEQARMWISKTGEKIFPSDAINPKDSTTTRSINRKLQDDTNSADDWYIVNMRKATFGAANSTEVYVP